MVFDGKILKGLIPYFGGFLIVCGYLRLSFYYNHFGIEIINYIELTEILSLFINDAVVISILFLSALLITFLVYNQDKEIKEENEEGNEKLEVSFYRRVLTFINGMPRIGLTELLFSSVTLFAYFIDAIAFYFLKHFFFFIMGFYFFSFIISKFKKKYKIIYGSELSSTYHYLFFFIYQFVGFSFVFVVLEIIKTEKNKMQVSFVYSEKIVKSNENSLYVGETKEYLFLYDKKMKTASVFPRKDISDFKIKKIE